MNATHSRIVGNKSVTIIIFDDRAACVYEQAINPKTGKGWQAHRNSERFDNKAKALRNWLYRK